MKCELCGKDPDHIFMLPIHQVGGKLCTLTCKECAEESSAFCLIHNKIHQGFVDGTTACLNCIEEVILAKTPDAFALWNEILENLPPAEIEKLREAFETSSLITGDGEEISTLRFLVFKALRTGKTLDDVLQEIKEERSVRIILY